MAKVIDAVKAEACLRNIADHLADTGKMDDKLIAIVLYGSAIPCIREQPAVEIEPPVLRAKWKFDDTGCFCTHCKEYADLDIDGVAMLKPYCPNCGAEMEEKK